MYALNKSDLADPVETEKWKKQLTSDRSIALSLDSTVSKSSSAILSAIKKLCGAKIDKFAQKGVKTTIKVMVLGVPNTGKSTLINALAGRKAAVTGDKPGVTKDFKWIMTGG